MYDQTGKLDFVDNTVSPSTDTVILRGSIANPPLSDGKRRRRHRARTGRRRVRHRAAGRRASRCNCWPSRARRCCPTSRATTSIRWMRRTRCSRRASSLASPRRRRLGAQRPDRGRDGDRRRRADACGRAWWCRLGRPARRCTRAPACQARRRLPQPMISAVFIRRPRLAIVIAIVITIAGALAMLRIPVAQLPDIVPPQVTVTANYPGASANGGGERRRPADRGAGRRRRQDDLHEVEQRQRRQLFADRQLRRSVPIPTSTWSTSTTGCRPRCRNCRRRCSSRA